MFSLIDEATDIGVDRILNVLVRFHDEDADLTKIKLHLMTTTAGWIFEVDEDEKLLSDPVHYQEEAGPSGTERTQPPTTSFETLSLSRGDCAENKEHEEYEPPACQLKVVTARTSGTLQVSLPLGHKL
ncbi:hypothetical protein XENORESO_017278 [Xenotaenia resolanae]|uniref:Uncharacterized protein n=1 Tax=Xenotaenia resolanae TaxID=208358 RepID=A0ABV0VZP7_9TELE